MTLREQWAAASRRYRAAHPDRVKASNARTVARTTRTYRSWQAMKQRCTNPKRDNYARYGGLGVTYAERWAVFANFLTDMGERPEGTSLDRIDVNGNYEPGNTRWATAKEQQANKREKT